MPNSRDFQDIRILIPGYSIEDLPTDLNEANASSLLNAFSVAWHPYLLNSTKALPDAFQAESTELPTGQHIIFVPQCSEDWLAHDWEEQLSDTLSVTFHNCVDLQELLPAIDAAFRNEQPEIDSELLLDFFALGTHHLLVKWLSRRMHHYNEPDQNLLESETFAAAEAAIAGDGEKARDHLHRCFECLLDCREQFYPTDCFLLDICLPSEQTTPEQLTTLISGCSPLSLICSGRELVQHRDSSEFFEAALRGALADERLSLLTGQYNELRTSLGSLSAAYGDVELARNTIRCWHDSGSMHWARRRFGMTSSLPALLNLFDVSSALHIVLDDGIYPDREYGQLEWQAPDGSTVSAVSRIPMAIDGSASFLRFVDRFTESLQEDSTAVMLLARLPELQTPWLSHLKRGAAYAPVLGRFVTMTDFIDQTCGQASPTKYNEGEYLSPYLIQSSVLKTEAPISSPAAFHAAHAELEAATFLEAISTTLKPALATTSKLPSLEFELGAEQASRLSFDSAADETPAKQHERLTRFTDEIKEIANVTADRIRAAVPSTEATASGLFLINPLPWQRSIIVPWTAARPPAANASITDCWQQNSTLLLEVDLPAGGFVWLHEATGNAVNANSNRGKALAETLLLRNKFFEVQLSEKTGGIAGVVFHGQRANRVSQQVAFRYEQSKTITTEDEEITLAYAAARLVSSRITASGPLTGSVETTSEIVDVATGAVMATYRQTTSVERNSPRLHVRIEFDDIKELPTGNPWMTYYAARIAWDNEAASIVRSCLGQAAGFRMERFEAPDYIEVADQDHRLLILPHGRPYHRRSGYRMLDSLLLVEGEDTRVFDFTLEFDQSFPMRSATEVLSAPIQRETSGAVPAASSSGWIIGLSAKNVVAARTRVAGNQNSELKTSSPPGSAVTSVVMLLQETEGRSAKCLVKTARPPKTAQLRKATGEIIQQLPITDKGVAVEFSRFQLKEIELTF